MKKLENNKTYYRVFDYQRGCYFAVGYNSTSKEELINDFKDYIEGANEVENINQFTTLDSILEYLQGVELEESETPFEEYSDF